MRVLKIETIMTEVPRIDMNIIIIFQYFDGIHDEQIITLINGAKNEYNVVDPYDLMDRKI